MMIDPLVAQNWMTFIGILILAIPVWSLNFRKKSLHQIEETIDKRGDEDEDDSSIVTGVALILKNHRQKNATQWRRVDEICLAVGYFLLLGGAGWRLLG